MGLVGALISIAACTQGAGQGAASPDGAAPPAKDAAPGSETGTATDVAQTSDTATSADASVPSACPSLPAGKWVSMSLVDVPMSADRMLAVWTGRLLVAFTASEGGVFDPCANRWRRASLVGMPSHLPLYGDSLPYPAIAAGDRIVFLFPASYGNLAASSATMSAAIYDVAADRWSTVPLGAGAPPVREGAVTVWTGKEIVLWGGVSSEQQGDRTVVTMHDDGGRLDPATGRWTAMSKTRAPSPRSEPTSVWTGSRLVVFGGMQLGPACLPNQSCAVAPGGGLYDPSADAWVALPAEGAPTTGLLRWTGKRIVVWGSSAPGAHALFDPTGNRWEPMGDTAGVAGGAKLALGSWVDGDRFVAVDIEGQPAAAYDLERRVWSSVPAVMLPPRKGWGANILGSDGRFIADLGTSRSSGIPVPGAARGGRLVQVNASKARWELAAFPEADSPPSVMGGVVVWTGDRLVVWGGMHEEQDPAGNTGCQNVPPGVGCDPVVPVKRVRHNEGAMLVPVFAPVN
jgi:hypothetical protein